MSSDARAIVSRDTYENGGWKMEDVKVRKPGDGELLVEMVGSGICHTDVLVGGIPDGAVPTAFYPRILGHEGGGYVKEVGPGVTVAKAGDPVLLSFTYCDKCAVCKTGQVSHCVKFAELNFAGPYPIFSDKEAQGDQPNVSGVFFGQSSFASLSVVHQQSVVNVRDLVKDKRELQLFSPLGCGIQTGSGTVVNAAKATPDDLVVIIGLGGVGLSAIMGAKIQTCRRIIGVDRVDSRMQLAKEMGCTDLINTSKLGDKTLIDTVRELTDGLGATVVVDTTGVPALVKDGIEFTRNRGKFIQVGSTPMDYEVQFNLFSFMLSGKELIGAIEGLAHPPTYVPKMIQWYREGRFPIDKMVKFIKAEDFDQGLKEMHDGSTIKPVLCWS